MEMKTDTHLKVISGRLSCGPLLLAVAALFFTACGTNTNLNPEPPEDLLEFGSEATLDVITWNLRTFPLSDAGLQTIAQIVPKLKADVIALQEIMDYYSLSELDALIPNYNILVYNATSEYRLAYIYDSRSVQADSVYTIYNGQSNPFPRPPYLFEFEWQGRDFTLINNHLKASGDNFIDETDPWDEEYRRRLACQMLDQYIGENLSDRSVILVGDLNDQIAEPPATNVFQVFLDQPEQYLFADMGIALNPSYATVSYPSYNPPSHLDHILLTNELFPAWISPGSECRVIRVEDYLGGWQNYHELVSDHRPLGVKLDFGL